MKVLMLETNLQNGATAKVRTIKQDDGSFVTVAYLPAGISNMPEVWRYEDGWEEKHSNVVNQVKRWMGIKVPAVPPLVA